MSLRPLSDFFLISMVATGRVREGPRGLSNFAFIMDVFHSSISSGIIALS